MDLMRVFLLIPLLLFSARDQVQKSFFKVKSFRIRHSSEDIQSERRLMDWIRSTINFQTGFPLSFQPLGEPKKVYQQMGEQDSVTGIIERLIVAEGISVYDAAVWQIVLTLLGDENDLKLATRPLETYWRGSLGEFVNIRAGFSSQPFVYNPDEPATVLSDLEEKGRRGFVFRILNAYGRYDSKDPLDNKTHLNGFPNYDRIHWEDWKPIAGENAWIVLAALHIYHKKYFDPQTGKYPDRKETLEAELAREIARAALLLQADNGGIRMAPLGTYYHLNEVEGELNEQSIITRLDKQAMQYSQGTKTPQAVRQIGGMDFAEHHFWYYDEISTENNLSWYAAFRMLFKITQDKRYSQAMDGIEQYLKSMWNADEKYFYHGAHWDADNKRWLPNKEHFATDVQNWALVVLGPQMLDEWFGEKTAYKIWQRTKLISGVFDRQGQIKGVGFTKENDRISIEWSAGAIFALRTLVSYYEDHSPQLAKQAELEIVLIRKAMDEYRFAVSEKQDAYSYSSKRGWIPFGWFSHDPHVLSLVSTSWMLLVDGEQNPFELPQ